MLSYYLLCASIRIISFILLAHKLHVLFDVSVMCREWILDLIIRSEMCTVMPYNGTAKAWMLSGNDNFISD